MSVKKQVFDQIILKEERTFEVIRIIGINFELAFFFRNDG